MAINWGSLIFGGVDSSEYGIYLSGEGVYNAPERAVNVVDVPGRNGAVLIDQGHWNNIEVVYKAGVFGANQESFSEKISAFRNAILSQIGYQQLTDTYHPEEYRMGAYVSGLDVAPASMNRAGEFELVFNCKPQRWLVYGDLPIPVDSGDVLQNPTEYESSPLLEITGYGNVNFNNRNIVIESGFIGNTPLLSAFNSGEIKSQQSYSKTYNINSELFNTGDTITVGSHVAEASCRFKSSQSVTLPVFTNTAVSQTGDVTSTVGLDPDGNFFGYIDGTVTFPATTFTAGTPGTKTCTVTFAATGQVSLTTKIAVTTTYSITNGVHSITRSMALTATTAYEFIFLNFSAGAVSVNSTISRLGNPTYIDCDLGEAYKKVADDYVSLNEYIDLGSDLPTLAPGLNKVTYDNTITDLKIAPRWWKL